MTDLPNPTPPAEPAPVLTSDLTPVPEPPVDTTTTTVTTEPLVAPVPEVEDPAEEKTETDADGNPITVDTTTGNVVDPTVTSPEVGPFESLLTPPSPVVSEPASTVTEDEPIAAASTVVPPFEAVEVTPVASEQPTPTPPAPVEGPLLPTDGNWSPEQIAAADKLGIDTPAGAALSAASQEILRGLEHALAGIEFWVTHARSVMEKLPEKL